MFLEISRHSRQLVGCQMPNLFSRIAGASPRVSTASTKLPAIVSATVSTAVPAMPVPPACCRPGCRLFLPSLLDGEAAPYLTPRFLPFPPPFAARAGFLGAEIEFLDVGRLHQPRASVVHHDAADFQHVTVVCGLQCNLWVLLDQQDR